MTPGTALAQLHGSHTPILAALLQLLHPRKAIECGCGNYSTPLLASHVPQLTTIEHDPAWAQRMQAVCFRMGHHWLIEPIPGLPGVISCETPPAELNATQIQALGRLYGGYTEQLDPPDLLFVDTFACARVFALAALAPMSDVVVLHDSEPAVAAYYRLQDALPFLDRPHPRNHYSYRPGVIIDGRSVPHTDLWSRRELDIAALQSVADPLALELWGQTAPLLKVS
jgi:hypothetical protein